MPKEFAASQRKKLLCVLLCSCNCSLQRIAFERWVVLVELKDEFKVCVGRHAHMGTEILTDTREQMCDFWESLWNIEEQKSVLKIG